MEHKILIADDSLTIQKVIKITLANEPFELHECREVEKLSKMLESVNPAMVLLDFNLSENKTGYDLCREIKSHNPKTNVLMLFGTFDTIDEDLLNDCGCNYHIVKPFDGTKFINLCRAMADDYESYMDDEGGDDESSRDSDFSMESFEEEQELPEEIEDEVSSSGEDEWVVNQPQFSEEKFSEDEAANEVNEDQTDQPVESATENKLAQEVESWGMEVPSVIGREKSESEIEIPGVISNSMAEERPEDGDEEAALPESSDLEYPDLGAMAPESASSETEGKTSPRSQLISLSDLKVGEDSFEVETNEVSGASEGGTDTEEGVKKLEEQIRDEIEDQEEDLWAADIVEEGQEEQASEEDLAEDEFKPFSSESVESVELDVVEMDDLPRVQPHSLEDVSDYSEDQTPEDFPEDIMQEDIRQEEASGPAASTQTYAPDLSAMSEEIQSKLEKELEQKLSPLVERFVKDYCKNQIEKIAWEVIPDLAENIIKKEIQKISDSIMDQ